MADNSLGTILSGAVAGGFKAWGEVSKEEMQNEAQRVRDENLSRLTGLQSEKTALLSDTLARGRSEDEFKRTSGFTTEERTAGETFEAGESAKERTSREKIAAETAKNKSGYMKQMYDDFVEVYGPVEGLEKFNAFVGKKTGEKEPSASDKKNEIEMNVREVAATLESFGVPVVEGGTPGVYNAIIQTDEKGNPLDPAVLDVIKDLDYKKGKPYMVKDNWGPNNTYGIYISFTGSKKAIAKGKGILGDEPTETTSEGESVSKDTGEPQATKLKSLIKRIEEASGKNKPEQTPGLLGDTKETTAQPTREELSSTLRQPATYQTGAYKPYSVIKDKVQNWASQTTPANMSKFGEGPLETAIRQSGFGKNLAEIKDMANNLRRKYPKMSDQQLIELVKKSVSQNAK